MARFFKALGLVIAIAMMSSAAYAQCSSPSCLGGGAGAGIGAGGGCLGGGCGPWNRPYTEESSADLFYDFYQPGNGGSPARAFPSPYPTPGYVGHQYTTYQPFMPNEWLYHHHRTYHQSYNMGMGLNRTKVKWGGTPIHTGLLNARKFFSLPR